MHRLLIVTERFWPEEFIVNDLAAELARTGLKVTVFTQQPSYPRGRLFKGRRNELLSRESWNGVDIVRFKTILGYRESVAFKLFNYAWFAAVGSLFALVLRAPCDAILIYQTGPLTMAVPGIVRAKAMRKPVAIWTQDVWPDSVYAYGFRKTSALSGGLSLFVRWVYASVDAVLVSCEGFRKILGKYSGRSMIYAPNWPLMNYTSDPGRHPTGTHPLFLFAGNVGKVQNLENVLRGYARAFREDQGVGRLRIVGDGSFLTSLQEMARVENVPVSFPGRKPSDLMGEEYDNADFCVLSLMDSGSLSLTVPSKFQMYLSVGKPILCAAGGEVARLVRDLDIGVTCDPDDPADIARGFRALSDAGPRLVARWSENARAALQRDFNRIAVIDLIRETLGSLRDGEE